MQTPPFTKYGSHYGDTRYELHVPKSQVNFWLWEGFAWMAYGWQAPEKWAAFERRQLLRAGLAELRSKMAQPGARFSRTFWERVEWALAAVEVFLRGELDPETADSAAGLLASLEGYRTSDGRWCFISAWQTVSSLRWNLVFAAAGFSRD